MSNMFKIRISFGVLLLCFVTWLSFFNNALLHKEFGLIVSWVIALQFFLLGHQYHQERTEKNADS
jgi:hypothetical protein